MRVVVLIALVCVACTKTNPLDCADGTCSDPAHPYCDKDGTVAGVANACIAVTCSAPAAFVECNGDTAVSCNPAGDGYVLTPCMMGCADAAQGCNMCTPNGTYCTAQGVQHCGPDGAPTTLDQCSTGCSSDPSPHCMYIVPRYLGSACDTAATGDDTIVNSATLSTDLDTTCTGGILQQTAAPAICIVRNKTIAIAAGATLRVTGSRLLALVADDDLSVHGTLDASADISTPGPGACDRSSGGSYGSINGGGGAGFKTAGGAGGTATADGAAANGGAAETDPAQLAVLVGGPCATNGGGGGGGVALVACRGAVSVDGIVDLGGGGGIGGNKPLSLSSAGHGGGAGGNLVIQAFNIVISGGLFANGGGGGAGYTSTVDGRYGADGSRSSTVGAAGGTVQGGEGAGGNGAAGTSAGAPGDHPGGTGKAGGGGGGLGFLQTYTPTGVTPTLTPSDVSPPLQPNLSVPTK